MPGILLAGAARSAVFAPLGASGRVEAVVARLSEAIHLGLIHPGEQLPSEQELATQLGVSTVTLREALAALREQGLVETRRGRSGGSFAKPSSDISAARARRRLRSMTSHELRDLADVHIAIAGAASRLAADRAPKEFLARLAAQAAGLRNASSLGQRRRADGRFRIEVAAAAQSVRLTKAEIEIQADLGELAWLPYPGEPRSVLHHQADVADLHAAVVDAIEQGDGETARRITEQQLEESLERTLEVQLALEAR